jgi:two-component system CheB/CheR fusion protein
MNYNSLTADVRSVLQTLVPKQMDVRTHDGKWYSMRIQPYRTLENVIEGAVITFVEITDRQQNQLDESDKS